MGFFRSESLSESFLYCYLMVSNFSLKSLELNGFIYVLVIVFFDILLKNNERLEHKISFLDYLIIPSLV